MTEDEAIERFGLPAAKEDRLEICDLLDGELAKIPAGESDDLLIKCLAVQLFSVGEVEDSLRIWQAKASSFDLMCGLDVQFLCGSGIEQTREYLAGHGSDEARAALRYLGECILAGDFSDWTPGLWIENYRRYYGID